MKFSQHIEKRLLRGLRFLAEAEKEGRRMSARDLGLNLGMAESAGIETRQLLLKAGLLVAEQSRRGGAPRIRVSDGGWYALGETPPAAEAAPPAKKTRRCLTCRTDFEPDGPMYVCDRCKGTEAWRSGEAFPVHTGTHTHRGAA